MQAQTQTMAATRVTVDEVRERLRRGEPLVLLDARNASAWAAAETMLPGALRVPAEQIEQLLDRIPREHAVIPYCT